MNRCHRRVGWLPTRTADAVTLALLPTYAFQVFCLQVLPSQVSSVSTHNPVLKDLLVFKKGIQKGDLLH